MQFLYKIKTPEGQWRSFTECWSTVYPGLPNVLRLEQQASFNYERFISLVEAHGVSLQMSGVEIQNSLAQGELYHAPPLRIFQLLAKNNPTLKKALILTYDRKAVKDTSNIHGLVPSFLVFGVAPSFPISNKMCPIIKRGNKP